jgi:hypothetical protein
VPPALLVALEGVEVAADVGAVVGAVPGSAAVVLSLEPPHAARPRASTGAASRPPIVESRRDMPRW